MKRFLLLAVLASCAKPNDIKTLHQETLVTEAYYKAELEQLDKRVQAIFKRGTTIPANLPGIEDVGKRLTEARDTLVQLKQIAYNPGPDGKTALEKQADDAAKKRSVDQLAKLNYDTERALADGTLIIRDDLSTVENWIALYDQGINRTGPAPQQPVPATPQGNPATPPSGNQPAPPP
jgi:hypothetical protein